MKLFKNKEDKLQNKKIEDLEWCLNKIYDSLFKKQIFEGHEYFGKAKLIMKEIDILKGSTK